MLHADFTEIHIRALYLQSLVYNPKPVLDMSNLLSHHFSASGRVVLSSQAELF